MNRMNCNTKINFIPNRTIFRDPYFLILIGITSHNLRHQHELIHFR